MFAPFVTTAQATHIDQRVSKVRFWRALLHGIKTFMSVLALGLLAFLVVSGPAQWERATYFFRELHETVTASFVEDLSTDQWISPTTFLDEPTFESIETVEAPQITSGHLLIPAINVDAPILWDVALVDALNGLQEGVVHARESYKPGEIGRTFIVGHSAGYWWNQNAWTKVFAVLDQLNDGDLIFLNDSTKTYAYKMTKSEVVSPDDVYVVRDDALDRNQLALMTCTPVGTTLNRLIVYAEPIQIR